MWKEENWIGSTGANNKEMMAGRKRVPSFFIVHTFMLQPRLQTKERQAEKVSFASQQMVQFYQSVAVKTDNALHFIPDSL